MQLVDSNCSDWRVISESGRVYDLTVVNGIQNTIYGIQNSWYDYDIVVIFDFDGNNENNKKVRIVDFFYGASDFIDHPENSTDYIKKAIEKYETEYGLRPKGTEYRVIKNF